MTLKWSRWVEDFVNGHCLFRSHYLVVGNVMDWSLVCLQFLLCELACKLHLCHFHHLPVIGGCMLRCSWQAVLSCFQLLVSLYFIVLAATRRSNKSLCVNWRILVKIFVSATEFCCSNVSQKIKSDRICATCFAPTYCCKLSPNVFRPWGSELAEKGAEERFLSGSYVSYMLADRTIPKDC